MDDDRQKLAINPKLHERVKNRAKREGKTLFGLAEQLIAFGMSYMDISGKPKAAARK